MPTRHLVSLVTGATFGIGKETALGLARRGDELVIVGRDPRKTEETVAWLRSESGNPRVTHLLADLSSQAQVVRLANEFQATHQRLDVLVNNAGGLFDKRQTTVDGFELTWGLNHLAYFTLTLELLELLKAAPAARVVNVSSAVHYQGKMSWDDLQGERSYSGMRAYNQSKLANVLFTYALARRLTGTSVTVNAVHPGVVASGFGHNNGSILRTLLTIARPFMKSAASGAATSLHVATAPEVEGVTGKYFSDSREKRSSALSRDELAQERLWELSLEQTKRPANAR